MTCRPETPLRPRSPGAYALTGAAQTTRRLPPTRLVVFLLSGIGDALMFTPALSLLRRTWPTTRIVGITMRHSEYDVLEHNRDLDDVRLYPFLRESLAAGLHRTLHLRQEGFDLSLLPCPSNRLQYNVIARITGAHERAAFRYLEQSRSNLDFLNTFLLPHRDGVHNAEHNLQLIESLADTSRDLVPDWDRTVQLPTTHEDRTAADGFLRDRRLDCARCIGLHVSSSRSKHMERKCWPKERFLALIQDRLARSPETRFLLFCGDEDLPESEWLAKHAGPAVHLAMRLPLRTVAELMRSCAAVVTNDSGLFHVACAMRTPTVVIFGPTSPQRTGPWLAPAEVVRAGLPCSPCFYHTSQDLTCRAGLDFACLREIPVSQVTAALDRALARNPIPAVRNLQPAEKA